jgi:tetratricopeptide (TPR) repeat protein
VGWWVPLVVLFVGAAMVSGARQGKRWNQLWRDLQAAWARRDYVRVEIVGAELARQRALPIEYAYYARSLVALASWYLGKPEEALVEFDRLPRPRSPAQLVVWLNNRAYLLGSLGRTDEALDHLRDAEDLQIGQPEDDVTAFLSGTRGIVLVWSNRFAEAEGCLTQALTLGDKLLSEAKDDSWKNEHRSQNAERRYWLSRVMRAKGDIKAAHELLRRAAEHGDSEFGQRARNELATAPVK